MNIGAQLRASRESKGLSIETVAHATRVQPRILSAIELNDVAAIPPRPFGRGFVRAYAREIGLDAESIVSAIEARIAQQHGPLPPRNEAFAIRVQPLVPWSEIVRLMLSRYRRRALLSFTLMSSQAFFYNAIFFTYALVLTNFYGIAIDNVGYYIFPFAVGNFVGPLLLGWFFEAAGRRVIIAVTYLLAGLGLAATG